jgi:hypothetical protein
MKSNLLVERVFLLNADIATGILALISRVHFTPCIIFIVLYVVIYIDNLMNSWTKLRLMMGYNTRAFALQQAHRDESQEGR